MNKQTIPECLPDVLLPWYEQNKRELPWREDKLPYHVWLSEIMLQQTRVEAVKGYYHRFLRAVPTVEALAESEDELLHKLWEGLGYYSRVRNLKKAARILMEDYDGVFPRDYQAVKSLPGIGAYTAGAICSICFDLPTPAVDGNVLRVYSRLAEDFTPIDSPAQKKAIEQAFARIYPREAGAFTQALMELGATLCGPNRKPDCEACPCRALCRAYQTGTAEQLPVKAPKRQRSVETLTVLIISCDGRYALEKRPDQGLLAGLWQFPNVPGFLEPEQAMEAARNLGIRPRELLKQIHRSHIFTHIRWDMRGIYLEAAEPAGDFHWLSEKEIEEKAALPTAFRQFWELCGNAY